MNKLSLSTKEYIKTYYKNEIKKIKEEYDDYKKKLYNEILNEIEKDELYLKINEYAKALGEKYYFEKDYIINKYDIRLEEYKRNQVLIDMDKRIGQLNCEFESLIFFYENYSKKSDEFKSAEAKIERIMKGEKND